MRIVQYMLGFRSRDGGVVRALVDLCNALAARGHLVTAMTTDDSDAPRNWDGTNMRPLLEMLSFSRLPIPLLGRAALNRAHQIIASADVVHLHVPWDPICVQLAGMCQRMNKPYIVTVHGMLDDWTMGHGALKKKAYMFLMGRRMLEGAEVVQSAAKVEQEQSARWYPNGKSCVIPLPFDLNEFARLPGPDLARQRFPQATCGPFRVLFLGRLHPIKRIDMLLEAIAILRDEDTAARLILAGSGEPAHEAQVKQRVDELKLGDRVHFVGFVTGETKLSLYQAADVAVLPSAHESFGYAIVEAMASGTPAIVTEGVNIWRELADTGGAMIVEPSARGLARALRELHDVPTLRADLGRRAREGVARWLDQEVIISQYETMYRDAVRKR